MKLYSLLLSILSTLLIVSLVYSDLSLFKISTTKKYLEHTKYYLPLKENGFIQINYSYINCIYFIFSNMHLKSTSQKFCHSCDEMIQQRDFKKHRYTFILQLLTFISTLHNVPIEFKWRKKRWNNNKKKTIFSIKQVHRAILRWYLCFFCDAVKNIILYYR